MGSLTDEFEARILDWLLTAGAVARPAQWWIGLGTGRSEAAGLSGEPVGNGYLRQAVTWARSGSVAQPQAPAAFGPNITQPWGSITHFGVFDAPSGGNCLAAASLTDPRNVQLGDTLTFAPADLSFTAD